MARWLSALTCLVLVACGGKSNRGDDVDAGTGDGGTGDAPLDAWPYGGGCTPGGPACANCLDDDGDGRIDGFDPQCTGPADDDEATFATGIPGDNKDAIDQDCFFDGDSGSGNDGCQIHVCCLLGATSAAECPIGGNRYDPKACPPPLGTASLPQKCIDTCGKLTPPGCDCFGCCTVCNPTTNQCYDIAINPADSVGCGPDTLDDPSKCLRCTKNEQCGTPTCGGDTCILCPGQDPADLPTSCNGSTACPDNEQACTTDDMCSEATYCANGCCIGVIL